MTSIFWKLKQESWNLGRLVFPRVVDVFVVAKEVTVWVSSTGRAREFFSCGVNVTARKVVIHILMLIQV